MKLVPKREIHCSCIHCEIHRDALNIVVLPDDEYDQLEAAFESGELAEQELVNQIEEFLHNASTEGDIDTN